MTERFAAVLAHDRPVAAPGGIDPARLRLAMLEDTYEQAADMGQVTAALALCPPEQPEAEAVTWPGTPILRFTDDAPEQSERAPASLVWATLSRLADLGADEGVVLTSDAPDLPIMLLGKLFQGLEHAEVAACPAQGGGLVGIAARLPLPDWLAVARTGLDTTDALGCLRRHAPSRRALSVSPGWRRVRSPADIAHLDPGLEGWEATRALLAGRVTR